MNNRIKKFIDIQEIEKNYRIEEDGAVWSYLRNRYLKPTPNYVGYYYVAISKPYLGLTAIHRLVACKYIGQCPEGLETSHKDGSRTNNHWTNLEYISHRDNIFKSYREHGRISYGPVGWCPSWETKQLMALRKQKPVCSSNGRVWDSIQVCADSLEIDRKAVYNSIRWNRPIRSLGIQLAQL